MIQPPQTQQMKNQLVALFSGLLFALGLGVAGMTLPSKVMGFLDFFGHWDPSLAFVMMGAIGVNMAVWRYTRRMGAPLFATTWQLPTRRDIDPRLVLGAVLFGLGWGLGGFCPGPALVSVVSGRGDVFAFVIAMLAGMGLFTLVDRRLGRG